MKCILIAVVLLLGLLIHEVEAKYGGSSHASYGSSYNSPSSHSRRPSGSDPNDPRWRKGRISDYLNSDSGSSDDDKKYKKKKKRFFF